MRVTVYDKNPGPGFKNKFLAFTWFLGCFIQKLFRKVDKYYAAESWQDMFAWIQTLPAPVTSIQYWGHGSPGCVWMNEKNTIVSHWASIKDHLAPDTVIWFRTCSTFHGQHGYNFSAALSNLLNCTVAGHTRTIGPLQGGLHTRGPHTMPRWFIDEGEAETPAWLPPWLRWGNNTVTCFATKIPEGW